MKINITIDLDDFMGNWSGGGLNDIIQEEMKSEVLKNLKKSPEYKSFIKKKTEEAIRNL